MNKSDQTKLAELVGKVPKNWADISLEKKIKILDQKARILFDGNHMYDLCLSYSSYGRDFSANLSIEANEDHRFTENGACFALTKPVGKGNFDITAFPEYLRDIIEEKADEDWETNEKDYNILSCSLSAGTFVEVVEKMYVMLDLLTCGYELTEYDWFVEKHPDLYPEEGEEDLW